MAASTLYYYQTPGGKRPFVEDIDRAKDFFKDYKARTAKGAPRGRR